MISFKVLTEENKDELIDKFNIAIEGSDAEYLSEIICSLLEDDTCEYAVSHSTGCLLVRIFDGKYCFLYPVAVCDDADESIAAYAVREYAVKEEIPLIYTDVPREELGNLIPAFRHANVDAIDEDGESFTVKIVSEVSLYDEIPTVSYKDISLEPITESDDTDYSKLCKDKETNLFWGYDYSADVENPNDSYFREMVDMEFSRGVAMSFGVRANGRFVGEAGLYAFDLIGGCECAVRILPEFRRAGIATKAMLALHSLAKRMGLINVYATVDNRNEASKKLCEKCFDECCIIGDKYKFYSKL